MKREAQDVLLAEAEVAVAAEALVSSPSTQERIEAQDAILAEMDRLRAAQRSRHEGARTIAAGAARRSEVE